MLGRLVSSVDDETLVCVVSDHGAKTWLADVDVRGILVDAGLMEIDTESGQVVWERTKAVPQRACYVYVNLRGRDPDGIVEPGREYEAVRDCVIDALHDYVEPVTQTRPCDLALRREDARVLGLYGPRVGDVVYALRPPFGHEHGQSLSSGRFGRGSLESTICLAGPGIKHGHVHEGMTGIQDVVPTLCYLVDIPVPAGCEGAIIYDALENPSFRMAERARLGRELARWKDAYERQVSITHSRF
jgi:predicted AlkP superfamily phosphohydrolase/phosphomutase